MSASVGAAKFPNMPDDTGGVSTLSWGADRLPAPSGGAGGLAALSGGEAELPARVVTMDKLIRIQGWSCKR